MKKCHHEALIDLYLTNRLSESEKENFEEHYFNCSNCFEKTAERARLMEVIKKNGAEIFKDYSPARKVTFSWYEKALAFLTPKQWVTVAVSAAILLIAIFIVLPRFRESQPQFFLSGDETVRGENLSLISPVIDVAEAPSYFEWKKMGDDVEYKISLSNHGPLWTTTTKENRIDLPAEIRNQMVIGGRYSWQVRAYSPQGILIAVSSRVQFKITAKN